MGKLTPTCQLANYQWCVGNTVLVCSTIMGNTAQGLCDMVGNVWEWVLDEWHASYDGAPVNEQAWCSDIGICNTNTSVSRVCRSSSFYLASSYLHSTSRHRGAGDTCSDIGFRVSRSVP